MRHPRRTVHVRGDPVSPDGDGPTLIRAVVHARLLGLRILTLDARVVVAEPAALQPALIGRDADPTRIPLGFPAGSSGRQDSTAVRPPLAIGGAAHRGGGLGKARELLAQGADTLAGLRRA